MNAKKLSIFILISSIACSHAMEEDNQQDIQISRLECALRYFPETDVIEDKAKEFSAIIIGSSCSAGIGKLTLARAIAYKLGLKEQLISPYSLVGKNPLETSYSIFHVFNSCSSQKNRALIIDNLQLLTSVRDRYTDGELNIQAIKNGIDILRNTCKRNMFICTTEDKGFDGVLQFHVPLSRHMKVWPIVINFLHNPEQNFEIARIMLEDHNAIMSDSVVDLLRKASGRLRKPAETQQLVHRVVEETTEHDDRGNPIITKRNLIYTFGSVVEILHCMLADKNATATDGFLEKILWNSNISSDIERLQEMVNQLVADAKEQAGNGDADEPFIITMENFRRVYYPRR